MKTMRQQQQDIKSWLTGILVLLGTIALSACGTSKKSTDTETASVNVAFNADSAYAYCAAQCAFGPRTMNSEAHERCGEWIAQRFRDYGCTVELQQADLKGYDGTLLKSTNIIARQQSADNSKPRLLLCAHWDSRPWADNDADEANWRKPVMGANDGASGVAVMLEVARVLQQNDSAGMAVDFICFDAEDWGIPQWKGESAEDSWALGAQYWAEHLQGQEANYQFGILLDMVGGQGARFFREGFSMRHARPIVEKVWQAAHAAGYGSMFPAETGGYVTDDHLPINEQAHIPCIDIINYYPDCEQSTFGPTWHTVHDDVQHIDKNTLQAVGQTLVQVIFQK